MSVKGLKPQELVDDLSWPQASWTDRFDLQREHEDVVATLKAYLDIAQVEELGVQFHVDVRGRGKNKNLCVKLSGTGRFERRCILTGEPLIEAHEFEDRFDFIEPAHSQAAQADMEASWANDMGTGLEEGPDIWDPSQPPTLLGLLIDALEEVLDPAPQKSGASVALQFAQDPREDELATKTHPFAALKALKK